MSDENPFAPPTAPGPGQDPPPGRPQPGPSPAGQQPFLSPFGAPGSARPGESRPAPVGFPVPPGPVPPGPDRPASSLLTPQSALPPVAAPGSSSGGVSGGTPPGGVRRGGLGPGTVALVAVLALLAGLAGGIGGSVLMNGTAGDDTLQEDAALPQARGNEPVKRPEGSVASIAAKTLPSVVSIEVRATEGAATGSGMVLKENGYILTNNHVISPSASSNAPIFVTFADGHEKRAELVGATADYDLAVLKVDEKGLNPLVLGDSDQVVVGDDVLAAGSPLGLDATVTTGIVSALHRPVQAGEQATAAFIDAIQTDAAINPGNSGGPLLNSAGEVIGINSAIAQAPGAIAATGNIGLGFAIPSNQVRRTAEQIIETGTATFPVIGVLLDPSYQGEGVKVAADPQGGQPPVTPGGPADGAGIAPGDVILAINGRPVSQSDELVVAIRAMAPGDAVTLKVRPGGQGEGRDVRVVLDEKASS